MPLPSPTLHTPRLRLRPFAGADADALFALHSDAVVLRYWDSAPWTERTRAEDFLDRCRQVEEEDCVVNGEVSDSWVYGLLRREWDSAAAGPGA